MERIHRPPRRPADRRRADARVPLADRHHPDRPRRVLLAELAALELEPAGAMARVTRPTAQGSAPAVAHRRAEGAGAARLAPAPPEGPARRGGRRAPRWAAPPPPPPTPRPP